MNVKIKMNLFFGHQFTKFNLLKSRHSKPIFNKCVKQDKMMMFKFIKQIAGILVLLIIVALIINFNEINAFENNKYL